MKLLLVEDDDIQVRLYRRTITEQFDDVEVEVSRDVAAALEAMSAAPGTELPDLVFLDLRLPDGSGIEVLDEIRHRRELTDLPVMVWSSSDLSSDITTAYAAGAAAYVVKPGDLDRLRTQIRDSINFWRHVARAPSGERRDDDPGRFTR